MMALVKQNKRCIVTYRCCCFRFFNSDPGCHITEIARFSLPSQVSCLQLITASSSSSAATHVACGFWESNSIE